MANKLTATALACVLFAPGLTAASPQQPVIQGRIDGGVIGLPSAAPARSEAELRSEIAAQPQSTRAYIELAQIYRANNRIDEADAILRAGLLHSKQPAMLFEGLAGLYSPMYEPEKVVAVAEEWSRTAPGPRPLVIMATAFIELAKRFRSSPAEARVHLDRAAHALDDADRLAASDVGARLTRASLLRTKAMFETDPQQRARLITEADELTQSVRGAPGARMAPPQAPPPAPGFAPPGAVRVGGNIRQPAKIRDVRPQYSAEALAARIQGVVVLEIVVAEDGKVRDARILRSIPILDQLALEAVRQWEFTPTLLNGQPVPIIMTATVQFTLP